jgi:hypothetical protein
MKAKHPSGSPMDLANMREQEVGRNPMLIGRTNRRAFIAGLGSAAAWPLVAWAQQRERMRLIGVLTGFTSDDPEGQANLAAFAQGLQQLGWTVGRNVRIETRWGAGDAERYRKYAADWLRSRQTGSWSLAVHPWQRCKLQPGLCRSFLRVPRTRSALDTSQALRGRARIRPDLHCSNTAQAGNG